MSNTYYHLREVLKYKNFSSYAVTVFLCSVKITILNTILRIEFWIVCIVGFCLVFSCFYHCWCMWCSIVPKMLNTLWVSIIIIIVSILFYFVVQNEIRLLLSMYTIVAIKASIGVYGYNSSFILLSEWFMINTLAFSSSSSIKFFKWNATFKISFAPT